MGGPPEVYREVHRGAATSSDAADGVQMGDQGNKGRLTESSVFVILLSQLEGGLSSMVSVAQLMVFSCILLTSLFVFTE